MVHPLIGYNEKLLVGGRRHIHLQSSIDQDIAHAVRHDDGMAGNTQIKTVGEQLTELHSHQPAFGQECSVAFHDAEETPGCALAEDHRLAAQSTHLGSPDIEDIAMACQKGQVEIALISSQTIAQSGAIHKQRQTVLPAYCIEIFNLFGAIQCSHLRRETHIDHSRLGNMVTALVALKHLHKPVEHTGVQAPVVSRQSDDLVAESLHGTCLMHIDVTCFGTNDCLIRPQHSIYHRGVGLSTAGEKKHIRIGSVTSLLDTFHRLLCITVESIGQCLLTIGVDKCLDDIGMRPVVIVAFKGNHGWMI